MICLVIGALRVKCKVLFPFKVDIDVMVELFYSSLQMNTTVLINRNKGSPLLRLLNCFENLLV